MNKKTIIILIFCLLIIAGTTFFFIIKDKIFKDNKSPESSAPEKSKTKTNLIISNILFIINKANNNQITESKDWKLQIFEHGGSGSNGVIANSLQKTNGNTGNFFNKSGYNIEIIEKLSPYEYKVNFFIGETETKSILNWVKYDYDTIENNNHPANADGYIGASINNLSNAETTFILKFIRESTCVLGIGRHKKLTKNSNSEVEESLDIEDSRKYIGITDWGIDLFNNGKLIHKNKGPPDSTHTSSREQKFTDISDPYWVKIVENEDDAMQIQLIRLNNNINNINGYTTGDIISSRVISHKLLKHDIILNL